MSFEDFSESASLANTASLVSRSFIRNQINLTRSMVNDYYDQLSADPDHADIGKLAAPIQNIVFGVAIVSVQGGQRLAILANRGIMAPGIDDGPAVARASIPFVDAPSRARSLVNGIVSSDLPNDTLLLSVPEPLPHFNTGQIVSSRVNLGTLGPWVSFKGESGILTAGHVAPAVGSSAKCGCYASATVRFSISPAVVPAHAITADVAVVVPLDSLPCDPPPRQFEKTVMLAGGDIAKMIRSSSERTTQIMGYSSFIFVPTLAGMWGECYFTTESFSSPGDSGAPVVLDGTDELAGSIVGGSGAATSYIQNIHYQLAACGATLA